MDQRIGAKNAIKLIGSEKYSSEHIRKFKIDKI